LIGIEEKTKIESHHQQGMEASATTMSPMILEMHLLLLIAGFAITLQVLTLNKNSRQLRVKLGIRNMVTQISKLQNITINLKQEIHLVKFKEKEQNHKM